MVKKVPGETVRLHGWRRSWAGQNGTADQFYMGLGGE